ncbi:MAG: fibronectin type III domain-containing protein [Anaerovoracaceae bacterium]
MKRKCRLLSILLCVALVITMMPAAAFAATSNEITQVDITIAPEFTDYMTAGPEVTVTGSNFTADTTALWYSSGDKVISATNKSKTGVTYIKKIVMTAKGDYRFSVYTTVDVTGNEKGWKHQTSITNDGKTMTVFLGIKATAHEHTYGMFMSSDDDNHWWECTICGEKKDVKAHSFKLTTAGDQPAPGQKVTLWCSCGCTQEYTVPGEAINEIYAVVKQSPVSGMKLAADSVYLKSTWASYADIESIVWTDGDGKTVNVGDTFAAGKSYKVTVTIKAKSGISFKADSFNGSSAGSTKGINVLNVTDYETKVADTMAKQTLIATAFYPVEKVGTGYNLSVALPVFAPGDNINSKDYSKVFTYTGGGSTLKRSPSTGLSSISFTEGGNKTVLRFTGREWTLDGGSAATKEQLTIRKGIEYKVELRPDSPLTYYDELLETKITDKGSSTEISLTGTTAYGTYFFEDNDKISNVALTVTAPVIDGTPAAVAKGADDTLYTVGTPVWTPDDSKFGEKAYTVSIPVKAAGDKVFADDCVYTVNGFVAAYSSGKVSYTFPSLVDENKESIENTTIATSGNSYSYTGNYIKTTVTVEGSEGVLIEGTDYVVSYSNNKNVGKAKITIKGIGKYGGEVVKTFKINPSKVTVSKLTRSSSGKLKLTWKKHSTQTTGFQIQYSTSSTFKNAKTVTVSGKTATSKTISKLTKGKKYYVRVRAYKTVNGVKYYGSWSSKKSLRA